MTTTVRLVLAALLKVWDDNPAAALYGLEITELTGLLPGTTYPILQRFLDHGWLTDEWENLDPHEAARPRRRYYRLTDDGAAQTRKVLQEGAARSSRRSLARLQEFGSIAQQGTL
ncbi:MAG: helix-turn-helix transcriptional regulator [Pseudonocardiaceae bacterium]